MYIDEGEVCDWLRPDYFVPSSGASHYSGEDSHWIYCMETRGEEEMSHSP